MGTMEVVDRFETCNVDLDRRAGSVSFSCVWGGGL